MREGGGQKTRLRSRGDPVARRAARAGLIVWVALDALVAAITCAAGVTAPARVATVLARLPAIPILRAQLRRLPTAGEPPQVPLL
jgi:hypothetical protein